MPGLEAEHRPGVRLRGPRETQFDVDVESATRVDEHVAAKLLDFRVRVPSLLVSRQPSGALVEIPTCALYSDADPRESDHGERGSGYSAAQPRSAVAARHAHRRQEEETNRAQQDRSAL